MTKVQPELVEFTMPALGADMERGTLLEWLVSPGDTVRKGDIIAVVDTTKAAVEVECFHPGVVAELLVQPGENVPVGTALATLTSPVVEAVTPAGPERRKVPSPRAAAEPELAEKPEKPPPKPAAPRRETVGPLIRRLARQLGVDLTTVTGTGRGGAVTRSDVERAAAARPARRRVSPYAQRLARELGVDLDLVPGTGPDGVVTASDVQAVHSRRAAPRPPAPRKVPEAPALETEAAPEGPVAEVPAPAAPLTKERIAGMRQTTARLMARSKRQIPHYYLSTTLDMRSALDWLRGRNRALPVQERIVPAALLLKATAVAATKVRELNGFWVEDHFEPAPRINLGIAITIRGGGLVTPAILDAAPLTLTELMARLRDLVTRARTGHLRGAELTEGTLTVTNLGDLGVETVYGVIYPPQVALVGFGKIHERPYAIDGLLGVRPVITATLSADHRATDGSTGSRFLSEIAGLVGRPDTLAGMPL